MNDTFVIANYHYLDEHRVAPNLYGYYDLYDQFLATQLLDLVNSYRFAHHLQTIEVRDNNGEVLHEFKCNKLRAKVVRDDDKELLHIVVYIEGAVDDFIKDYILQLRIRFNSTEVETYIQAFPSIDFEWMERYNINFYLD